MRPCRRILFTERVFTGLRPWIHRGAKARWFFAAACARLDTEERDRPIFGRIAGGSWRRPRKNLKNSPLGGSTPQTPGTLRAVVRASWHKFQPPPGTSLPKSQSSRQRVEAGRQRARVCVRVWYCSREHAGMSAASSLQCEPSPLVTPSAAPSAGNTGRRGGGLPAPPSGGWVRAIVRLSPICLGCTPLPGAFGGRHGLSRWGGVGARPPSGLPTAAENTATIGRPPVAVAPYACTRSSCRMEALGFGGWSVVAVRSGREYRPHAACPALPTRHRGRDTSPAAAWPTLRVLFSACPALISGRHAGAVSGQKMSCRYAGSFSNAPRRPARRHPSRQRSCLPAVMLDAIAGRAHRRFQPTGCHPRRIPGGLSPLRRHRPGG